jgi:outer membrane protein TolC
MAQNETVFSINDYLQSVKKNHPLAKVASLSVTGAEAEITSARGEFDPVIQYNNHQKTFNNTNYYYYNNAELKVPLPIGMDIKAGAEDNGGNYITREVTTGKTSYLGVEVAVLKGMLMYKRRAALQQAKIAAKQTQQQRNAAINVLLLDAVKQHWQWYSAFAQKKLYEKFLNIAQNRLHFMVITYQQGDKALADTIEANAQVLNYIALLNDADVKLNKAILQLTDYLWDENEMPYVLPQNYDGCRSGINF